jgi:hypothetical protein
MAKVRDILTHVSIEVAKHRRICHHNRAEHSITKETACLVIKDPATGGGKNYCPLCASPILERAKMRISQLQNELASTGSAAA